MDANTSPDADTRPLTPLERMLVVETGLWQRAAEKAPAPPELTFAWLDWKCEQEHGPTWSMVDWLGYRPAAAEARRVLRALVRLEDAGLLIRFCRWGSRTTHVQLTPAGLDEAIRLLESGTVKPRLEEEADG
jgi:hypothetical protein